MEKKKTSRWSYSSAGYAVGESNGAAKLSNEDIILMLDYRDSCMKEIEEIEQQIEKLEARKIRLKKQITRRYIADW